jgi:hypothetical protein
MVKVSVLYPSRAGNRFDVEYYIGVHMPMAKRLLGDAVKISDPLSPKVVFSAAPN